MSQDKNCFDCANHMTPICNGCRTVEKPNGEITKSAFCREDKTYADDYGAMLARRVKDRRILPVRIVLKYNDQISKERENNGAQESGSTLQDT